MNKVKNTIIGSIAALTLMMGVVGCDFNDEQKRILADSGGMLVATGWIAIDNPSAEDKQNVAGTVDRVTTAVADVQTGEPFSTVLYPIATEWIANNVEAHQQPLALAGSVAVLNGVDMFFAANPDYLDDKEEAVAILTAFLNGAKKGLLLSPDNPVIMRAQSAYEARAQALSVE